MNDFLKFKNVKSLTEPQELALPLVIDSEKGSNLVVASPTNSGKTLIGEMSILETILVQKKKAAYLVPLKALAQQKFHDFRRYESKYGIRVIIRSSDYERDERELGNFHLIVSTYEKWDSMTRRRPSLMSGIGSVIVDEAHMVTDKNRGQALECTLTRMLIKYPEVRLVLLSAVLPNVSDFAKWLQAVSVVARALETYRKHRIETLHSNEHIVSHVSRDFVHWWGSIQEVHWRIFWQELRTQFGSN